MLIISSFFYIFAGLLLDKSKYFYMESQNGNEEQEFIEWLANKLQAKDQADLKSKVQKLGQEGIKQAHEAFLAEKGGQQSAMPMASKGAKLDYLKCLTAFKKGGSIGACGCNKDMEKGGKFDFKKKMNKPEEKAEDKKQGEGNKPTWLIKKQKQAEAKK